MLTVHLLQAGAQEAEDASGAAAIMWLQGDTQGAVHTLLQPLARGADAEADSRCVQVWSLPKVLLQWCKGMALTGNCCSLPGWHHGCFPSCVGMQPELLSYGFHRWCLGFVLCLVV